MSSVFFCSWVASPYAFSQKHIIHWKRKDNADCISLQPYWIGSNPLLTCRQVLSQFRLPSLLLLIGLVDAQEKQQFHVLSIWKPYVGFITSLSELLISDPAVFSNCLAWLFVPGYLYYYLKLLLVLRNWNMHFFLVNPCSYNWWLKNLVSITVCVLSFLFLVFLVIWRVMDVYIFQIVHSCKRWSDGCSRFNYHSSAWRAITFIPWKVLSFLQLAVFNYIQLFFLLHCCLEF